VKLLYDAGVLFFDALRTAGFAGYGGAGLGPAGPPRTWPDARDAAAHCKLKRLRPLADRCSE
jgi:hypothetical protein